MEIKIKSGDICRGETKPDLVYDAFNWVAPNLLEGANAFRYETQSGFVVETRNSVLPVFDTNDRSIDWYDLIPPSHADSCLFLLSEQQVLAQYFNSDLNAIFDLPAGDSYFFRLPQHEWQHFFNQDAKIISDFTGTALCYRNDAIFEDSAALTPFDPFTFVPCFYVSTAAKDQVQSSRPYFERYENRIISQKHSRLRAGKDYFVSQCEQERTEASAKDHVTHFESLTLSRDHSKSNLFSTAVQELKRFGWRTWRTFSSSSNGCSDCWARFARSGQLCPSFTAVVSQMI